MNINDIKEALKEIESQKFDFEVAHCSEETLLYDFVKFIAKENGKYSKLAREVLKAEDIEFNRCYAWHSLEHTIILF